MAATAASKRPFDVVVYGATGFTGKLVCEHLVRDYRGKVKWAIAGRDAVKLEQVKEGLAKLDPSGKSVPAIVADAQDFDALSKMAKQTRVVIDVAGPFAKYGTKVVEAAVTEGTHYCDITGEVLWVRRMIDRFHDQAAAKGVKVLNCCGYDSTPSDLGALFMVDHCRKKLGRGVSQLYNLVVDSRGGVSGGTLASVFNMVASEDSKELSAALGDLYYLAPQASRGPDKPPALLPRWNSHLHKWMAPFVMEAINSRVVHRSAALAPQPYGRAFKYWEAVGCPSLLLASLVSLLTVGLGAAIMVPPLRGLIQRSVPQPGEGPSRQMMEGGYWHHAMAALTEEADGQPPQLVLGKCGDPSRDAGYWGTSRMLLETGLCLALDGAACEERGSARGGVLTPASACGLVLVERLQAAGLYFEVTASPALEVAPLAAAAAAK